MQYTPDNKFNIQSFPTYLNCKLQVNQYAIKPLVAHQLTKTVSIVQVSWFTRGYFVFHFDFMDTGIVVSIRESSASLSQWHTHRTQKSNSLLIGADPTSNRPSPRKFTNLLQLALSLAPFCHCVPTWTPICNRFYLGVK